MFGLSLVVGGIFEAAALVFFIVADDPPKVFVLHEYLTGSQLRKRYSGGILKRGDW